MFDSVISVLMMGLPPNDPSKNEVTLKNAFSGEDFEDNKMTFPIDYNSKTMNSHAYVVFPATVKGLFDAKKAMEIARNAFKKERAFPNVVFHRDCMKIVADLEEQLKAQQSILLAANLAKLTVNDEWKPLPTPSKTVSSYSSSSSSSSAVSSYKPKALAYCYECKKPTSHKFVECPILLKKIRTGKQWKGQICRSCDKATQPNGHVMRVTDGVKWYTMCPKLKEREEKRREEKFSAPSPCSSCA